MARSSRRWAIRRADGCYAHGKPWEVEWKPSQEDCMLFERGSDARYLINKVLAADATVVLL